MGNALRMEIFKAINELVEVGTNKDVILIKQAATDNFKKITMTSKFSQMKIKFFVMTGHRDTLDDIIVFQGERNLFLGVLKGSKRVLGKDLEGVTGFESGGVNFKDFKVPFRKLLFNKKGVDGGRAIGEGDGDMHE